MDTQDVYGNSSKVQAGLFIEKFVHLWPDASFAIILYVTKLGNLCDKVQYEPHCEKTGLRGFRPGPT